jgi:pteridine reductase
VLAATPLARQGDPDDIAAALRYLVGDAPFVTGQILAVDGGRGL